MRSSVLWRDQLSRCFRILLTLLSDRNPNARELSELCEVSRRTIYRDLESLILAGVPIEFRPELRGYQIAPSFAEQASRLRIQALASLPSFRVLIRVPLPILDDFRAHFPRPLHLDPSTEDRSSEPNLEFFTDGPEHAVRELIAFAESIEILEPTELRAHLHDIAIRIAKRQAEFPVVDRPISEPGAVAG